MKYRFRKLIERPDWNPPVVLTIEILYDGQPVGITENEEVTGGVEVIDWDVVAIKGPCGNYHNPDVFPRAHDRLVCEEDFHSHLIDYAEEDFAQRDIETAIA